jgi:hypothetical protein
MPVSGLAKFMPGRDQNRDKCVDAEAPLPRFPRQARGVREQKRNKKKKAAGAGMDDTKQTRKFEDGRLSYSKEFLFLSTYGNGDPNLWVVG